MTQKPKAQCSLAEKELDKAEEQFKSFDEDIKKMTLDRMNETGTKDVEPQTKLSQADKDKMNQIYLKPHRTISSREKFNEKFRESYNFDKEYVYFTAENKEIIGETIELWTKPYPGLPAEEWKVPTNKPLWAPRYLAERIKGCKYHRLTMQENRETGSDNRGNKYFGTMVADTTIQRLDAFPESNKRSIFMGSF